MWMKELINERVSIMCATSQSTAEVIVKFHLSLDCFLKSFLIANTLLTYIAVMFSLCYFKLVVLFCRPNKVKNIVGSFDLSLSRIFSSFTFFEKYLYCSQANCLCYIFISDLVYHNVINCSRIRF